MSSLHRSTRNPTARGLEGSDSSEQPEGSAAPVRGRPTPTSRVLAYVAGRGRVGRELAWRADSARITGLIRCARSGPQHTTVERRWNSFYGRLWRHAAEAVGAELEDLTSGFIRLRKSGRTTVVWQSNVMLDTAVTVKLALDKSVCSRLLAGCGLPTPARCEFGFADLSGALSLLEQDGGFWVVKPASGTGGGKGVTCGISHADDLVRACVRARRWEGRLLMERQLTGNEYRLLFLDGQLLDVIRRRPPMLEADGHSTVEQLIVAENRRRRDADGRAGLSTIDIDLDCLLTLRRGGLSLASVPPAGRVFAVKAAANSGGPGDTETVSKVSPDLVEEACLAAATVGVRLAGVDVITPDALKGLREGGGAIVEVNALPGLHYHYLVSDSARATPVAVPILRSLLGEAA